MTDPLSGAGGDAAAQVDQWVAQAKRKAERYRAMQAAAGQVSVTESGKDGLVTVTVDAAGNVTDLRITDQVRELSGAQVAAAVLTTLRRAQSRLPERLGEVMAGTIGDDRQTMDTIVGTYRAKFPSRSRRNRTRPKAGTSAASAPSRRSPGPRRAPTRGVSERTSFSATAVIPHHRATTARKPGGRSSWIMGRWRRPGGGGPHRWPWRSPS